MWMVFATFGAAAGGLDIAQSLLGYGGLRFFR